MTPDLDTLVREADPVEHLDVPLLGSPHAEVLWRKIDPAQSTREAHRWRRPGHILWLSASGTTSLAVALLLVLLLPSAVSPQTSPAAAALARLANAAGNQRVPTLHPGQWLQTSYHAGLVVTLFSEGGSRVATATSETSLGLWASSQTTTCTTASYTAPTLSSTSDVQPWIGAGLPTAGVQPSAPSCTIVDELPSQSVGVDGAMDVSRLPTDPSTLARDLEKGTTGVPAVDNLHGSQPHSAFDRATVLLLGPTVGDTAAIHQAILAAMAKLPGVRLDGGAVTHSGASGLAFSAHSSEGTTTVVLSPRTGRLLEVRNLFSGPGPIAMQVVSTFATRSGSDSTGVRLNWIDPMGTPTVVNSPPAGADIPNTGPALAAVDAVTKPGVTFGQLSAYEIHAFRKLKGVHGWSGGESPTHPGTFTVEIVVHAPGDPARVAAVLRSSGLFTSVVIHR